MISAELGVSDAVRGTAEYSGDYSVAVGRGNRQFCYTQNEKSSYESSV